MEKVVFNNFLTPVWQETVKYIVIDEAHCIDKWGDSFRKEFGNLGRLRSLYPMAKSLALTGTATGVTAMNIKNISD
jgi:superfamily II DNA helicase RecQ